MLYWSNLGLVNSFTTFRYILHLSKQISKICVFLFSETDLKILILHYTGFVQSNALENEQGPSPYHLQQNSKKQITVHGCDDTKMVILRKHFNVLTGQTFIRKISTQTCQKNYTCHCVFFWQGLEPNWLSSNSGQQQFIYAPQMGPDPLGPRHLQKEQTSQGRMWLQPNRRSPTPSPWLLNRLKVMYDVEWGVRERGGFDTCFNMLMQVLQTH